LLIAMAAVYAIVSAVVGVVVVAADLRDVRREQHARNLATIELLDEHVSRALDVAELVTSGLAERAADLGLPAAANLLAGRGEGGTLPGMVPPVTNIYVVNPSGRLVMDAKGFHPAGSDFSDRDWVRAVVKDPVPGPFFGAAAFDDSSRAFAFPVALPARDRHGALVGGIAALVNMEYFKQFHLRAGGMAPLVLGVSRLDGTAVVRQPLKGGDLGGVFADDALGAAVRTAASGAFRSHLRDDPAEREVLYRVLPARQLVAWIAVAEDGGMDAWRTRALWVLLLVVAGWAVMAGLCLPALRVVAQEQRASEYLANLNRDLERSNADLEQFAYVASHDLKEPLRNIASYVQLLQRRYQGRLDPDADAFIGYTVDGVARLQTIINELLAYSRIGTGQLTLVPVQAGILVSAALAHLKGVIAEAQAVVEVKGPLPVVAADATQLGSLFQNLIANALKYRRDDVRPEVVIACAEGPSTWDFTVRDNGIGIDPQYHQQIFDLFKRLHPRDRYSGTGIGLAICQRVVERHGGRIWVESRPGEGSTFHFTLPKRQAG
jgi:signal transduction histidine kinase